MSPSPRGNTFPPPATNNTTTPRPRSNPQPIPFLNRAPSQIDLSPRTRILHHCPQTDRLTTLHTSFPTHLANLFCSTLITRTYNSSTAIVVSGPNMNAYASIFAWLYSCSDSRCVVPFPRFEGYIFYHNACISLAARALGIPILVAETERRLLGIARRQVHTEDVVKVYTDDELRGYRGMVARSVAVAVLEKRVKPGKVMERLRRVLRGGVFGRDVEREIGIVERDMEERKKAIEMRKKVAEKMKKATEEKKGEEKCKAKGNGK